MAFTSFPVLAPLDPISSTSSPNVIALGNNVQVLTSAVSVFPVLQQVVAASTNNCWVNIAGVWKPAQIASN